MCRSLNEFCLPCFGRAGVQNLVVEDISLKDCLRQGVDFAGAVAPGDAPSANFTARRVRDLQDSPGVTRGGENRVYIELVRDACLRHRCAFCGAGSTIHVEEAGGLQDVFM